MLKEDLSTLAASMFDKTIILERVYILAPRSEGGMGFPPPSKAETPHYLCWEQNRAEQSLVDSQDIAELVGLSLLSIHGN